jgi:hypothetical protein
VPVQPPLTKEAIVAFDVVDTVEILPTCHQ